MGWDSNSNSAPGLPASSSPSTASPSGKRSRDLEDDLYVDNLHSHKRYLSEIMASSLNGLTVGDPLPENLMESPASSCEESNMQMKRINLAVEYLRNLIIEPTLTIFFSSICCGACMMIDQRVDRTRNLQLFQNGECMLELELPETQVSVEILLDPTVVV